MQLFARRNIVKIQHPVSTRTWGEAVQLQSFDKRRKGPEKILRTPVTATRTGYELFQVGNNGEANQSKYPMELRARLTRQNLQCMYNTLRYKSIILLVSVQYMYRR